MKKEAWQLQGWDTFAGEAYPIPGSYRSREAAICAARRELKRIEKQQPSATSGGQSGIQDQVHVVEPVGTSFRVFPGAS